MSLTAVAMPTPTPVHAEPRGTARSTTTSTNSSRFTCPKPSVWRTGSVSSASGSATARTRGPVQPCRAAIGVAAIGAAAMASTTARAAVLASTFSQPAVAAGSAATGSRTSAANGG